MRKKTAIWTILVFLSLLASAQDDTVCVVYFTGIGCPHCAKTDPVVLGQLPTQYNGSVVIVEYEIYRHPENAQLMSRYKEEYDVEYGIPQIVFGRGDIIAGDKPILENIVDEIENRKKGGNACPILGNEMPFSDLNLNLLPASPQVWTRNRVLVREGDDPADDSLLKKILSCRDIEKKSGFQRVEGHDIPLSGGKIEFNKAISVGGWSLLYNAEGCGEGTPHEITGRWIWYYLEKTYWIVLAVGIAFIAYISIHERMRAKK